MPVNDVNSLINQQYGISLWRHSDTPIKRLRCIKQHSYSHLLSQRDQDDFFRDTPIFTCKFSPQESNEHLVALANEDGKLAIHNSNNDARHGIRAHNNAIFDLAWMFDQMKLVTASGDHTSKLFDVGNGDIRQDRLFCGHTRSVKTVAFRKDDSSVFATGGRDGNIILWDTRTNTSSFVGKADRMIINSHTLKIFTPSKSRKKFSVPSTSFGIKSVTGLVFQERNTLISCGAGDGNIKIWDLRKNYVTYKKEAAPKYIIPYPGNTTKNGYSSLLIDSYGIKLYANCLDNTIYCYNVGTYNFEPIMRYTGHQNSTFYVKSSLCPNGTYLMSGSSDENAYIWNTNNSEPLVKLTGHSAEVTCVAWCNNNYILITCSDDMTHKIWRIGPEELPEDWDINGRGLAEVLPLTNSTFGVKLKRNLGYSDESIPKKFLMECQNCANATISKFCKDCSINNAKRKNSSEIESANKIMQTEFGPRKLFPNMSHNLQNDLTGSLVKYLDNDAVKENGPPRKVLKLTDSLTEVHREENSFSESCSEIPLSEPSNFYLNDDCKLLNKLADAVITPRKRKQDIQSSPTINLPNYVIDGTAPHLNYSPPKKKCQDWLTKFRIDNIIRKDMYDKTVGINTPKQSKMESSFKTRQISSPKSPLLKYFKVTNSAQKCDGSCSKYQNCSTFASTIWKRCE